MIRPIIRWFRLVMPPRWVVVLVLFTLLSIEGLHLWAWYWIGVSGGITELRDNTAVGLMVLYGAFRVVAFHPIWRRTYREWLALIPWDSRKPLLLGPIHLVTQDLAVLMLVMLALYGTEIGRMYVAFAFLLSYLIVLSASFWATGPWWMGYLVVFGLGLAVRFTQSPLLASAVLVAMYFVAWKGLRMALARFPWPLGELFEAVERSVSVTARQRRDPFKATKRGLGWPYDQLRAYRQTSFRIPRRDTLLVPLLAGWCVYAVVAAQPDPREGSQMSFVLFLTVLVGCCMFRFLRYVIEHRPPISIFGRIATGRLIIPGYDRILAAPLCMLVVGAISPIALRAVGMSDAIAFPISISLVLLIAMNMGPSYERWRLTGHHRIAPQYNGNQEFVRL